METKNLIENEAIEAAENTVDAVELTENLGKGKIIKKSIIALCIGGAVIGITVAIRRNKDKLEKAMIKKLEKKGYTVMEPDDLFDNSFMGKDDNK